MLTAIVILLVLNILLNLAVGFLNVITLGELDATSKKYCFEFEPVISLSETALGADAVRNAAQNQFH